MIALLLKLGLLAMIFVAVVALLRALPTRRRRAGSWAEFEVSFDGHPHIGREVVRLRPRKQRSDLPE